MKVESKIFGQVKDRDVNLYTLTNDKGMTVTVMNYGATITSILVPDKGGKLHSVACGFDNLSSYFSEEYLANAPYFGCTVGRYCSQIKDAAFEMDGKTYKLADNCGANNLHGGVSGFDKRIWDAEAYEKSDEVGIQFNLISEDMEEGFPGRVEVALRMALTNNNEIALFYTAVPDKKTPLSMTNHTYFNLNAFAADVQNHKVILHSNKLMKADETGAATGEIMDVSGEADDLQSGKIIGDVHDALGDGFEHFYIFDNEYEDLKLVAEISSNVTGLKLEVETSEPCMLLYTGKYTSDALKRENGEQYGKFRGFCCETHRYQNGPNIPGSPGTFTEAGETFESQTTFRFL